eukprot:6200411-Pleurochrysis_carterae.AAC.3
MSTRLFRQHYFDETRRPAAPNCRAMRSIHCVDNANTADTANATPKAVIAAIADATNTAETADTAAESAIADPADAADTSDTTNATNPMLTPTMPSSKQGTKWGLAQGFHGKSQPTTRISVHSLRCPTGR